MSTVRALFPVLFAALLAGCASSGEPSLDLPSCDTVEVSVRAGSAVDGGGVARFDVSASPAPSRRCYAQATVRFDGDVAAGAAREAAVTLTRAASRASVSVATAVRLGTAPGAVRARLAAGRNARVGTGEASVTVRRIAPLSWAAPPPEAVSGEVGAALAPVALPRAAGGTGAVTYALEGCALPEGVSFSAVARVLSGTPAAAYHGPECVYVARDASDVVPALSHRIAFEVIAPDVAPLAWADADALPRSQSWETGTAQRLILPAATGGGGTISYALDCDLPAGLGFSPATRVLSGTPSVAYHGRECVYVASDAGGAAPLSHGFGLTVSVPGVAPLAWAGTRPERVVELDVGDRANILLPAARGGAGPIAYALESCELPDGLGFNATARTVSGVARAPYSGPDCVFVARDEGEATGPIHLTFRLVVSRPAVTLAWAGGAPAAVNAVVGTPFTRTLPALTGGTGAVTYKLDCELPDGLGFSPETRVLSGTPRKGYAGPACVYVATDAAGNVKAASVPLAVTGGAGLGFASPVPALVRASVREWIEVTLPAATGGVAPYTYALRQCAYTDAGLGFAPSARRLSGTLKAAYDGTLCEYVATDSEGQENAGTFRLLSHGTGQGALRLLPQPDLEYSIWQGFDRALAPAVGGRQPYTYTLECSGKPETVRIELDPEPRLHGFAGPAAAGHAAATCTYGVTDAEDDTASVTFALRSRGAARAAQLAQEREPRATLIARTSPWPVPERPPYGVLGVPAPHRMERLVP